jgi:hypothetical protein
MLTTKQHLRLAQAVAEQKKYPRANSMRQRAGTLVQMACNHGFLPLLNQPNIKCVDCGKVQAEVWEHRDYSRPLDVKPVCKGCNNRAGHAKHLTSAVEYLPWRPEYIRIPAPIFSAVYDIAGGQRNINDFVIKALLREYLRVTGQLKLK